MGHGLTPHLSSCTRCGAEPGPGDGFDAARGGIVCRNCGERSARPLLAGARLLATLQAGAATSDAKARAEAREVLDEFLHYHLGVRLRSARFMAEVGVE